jgi:hypothetical protein
LDPVPCSRKRQERIRGSSGWEKEWARVEAEGAEEAEEAEEEEGEETREEG